jgi:hypothetical protein
MINMPDAPTTTGGKTEIEWAWEFHKNCDQLLHQRLASFTLAQSMTLAAFTLLTVARFQGALDPNRVHYVEAGRYLIALFGLLMAVFGWLVTYPMLERLDYLNNKYLTEEIPVYKAYLVTALEGARLPWSKRQFPFNFYRRIIPIWLPAAECMFWILLIGLMSVAIFAATPTKCPSM